MRSRWELITPYYAHPEAAQATSCKMESLLSIYRSDGESEEEGVAARQEQQQQQRDSDDDSDDAAAGGGSSRTGTKKRPTAVDSAGSRKRRLVGTGTLPSPAAASAAASGLPGLDADFFSVSPNHVYTTVLTNGQRTVAPASGGGPSQRRQRFARAVPHVEGNWATHVYIRVPNTEAVLQLARACIARGQARLGANVLEEKENETEGGGDDRQQQSDGGSDSDESEGGNPDHQRRPRVIVPGDLRPFEQGGAQHLSLSRTAYLRSHHIDPCVADLRKALSWATSFTVGLEGAREGGFGLLVNDEKTRSFLTVGVGVGCDERLRRLVASVDAVLERYRQPTYYADPKFHVSVASLRGDVAAVWGAGEGDGEEEEEGAEATAVVVDTVECRVGHKLFEIPLRVL